METITEQLRKLGYTTKQIKSIHNRFFNHYNQFKHYCKVERYELGLRFWTSWNEIYEIVA